MSPHVMPVLGQGLWEAKTWRLRAVSKGGWNGESISDTGNPLAKDPEVGRTPLTSRDSSLCTFFFFLFLFFFGCPPGDWSGRAGVRL